MKAFLIDIGNVLLRFDFTPAAQGLSLKSDASTEEVLTLLSPFKDDLESGRISDEDFVQQSIAKIGFHGTTEEFAAHWNDIFTPNDPMIELLDTLASRAPLYLLSNTSGLHKNWMFAQYAFFAKFSGGIYSHEARCAKPHEEIFHQAIDTFGLEPAKTLFIDDLADNIAAARRMGFTTHQYRHTHHPELLTLLDTLA